MGNLTRHGENRILFNSISRSDFGGYMDSNGAKHLVLKNHNLDILVSATNFKAQVFKPYAGEPVVLELAQAPIIASSIAGKTLTISISNKPQFRGLFSRLNDMAWAENLSSTPSLLATPYNAAKLEDSALLDIAKQVFGNPARKYDVKVVSSDATAVYDTATATLATEPVAAKTGFKLIFTAKSNSVPIAYAGSYLQDFSAPESAIIPNVFNLTVTKGGVYPTGDPLSMGNLFINKDYYAFDRPNIPLEGVSYCRLHISYVVNGAHYANHGAGQTLAQTSNIDIWFPEGALKQANFWDKTKEVLATTNATTKSMLMSDVMVPDGVTPAPGDFGTFLDYIVDPLWSEGDGTIALKANEPNDTGTQNQY